MKGIFLSVFSAVFVFCLAAAAVLPEETEAAKREFALADILQDLYKNDHTIAKKWWGCEDPMLDYISFQHCMKKRSAALERFRRDIAELTK